VFSIIDFFEINYHSDCTFILLVWFNLFYLRGNLNIVTIARTHVKIKINQYQETRSDLTVFESTVAWMQKLNVWLNYIQCRRQSIQSRGPKFFLLILALEKHAVYNAITSIRIL